MGLPLIYTNGYKWRIFHVYVSLLERRWNPGTHTNQKCCSLVRISWSQSTDARTWVGDILWFLLPSVEATRKNLDVYFARHFPSRCGYQSYSRLLVFFPFTSKFSPYEHISYYQKFEKALGNWAEIFKEAYVHPRRSEISRSIDEVDESAWCSQERGNPIELNSQLGKRCLKSCSLLIYIYMLCNNWTRQGENPSWFLDGAPITEEEHTTYIEEIFHCHVWLPQDICIYIYICWSCPYYPTPSPTTWRRTATSAEVGTIF